MCLYAFLYVYMRFSYVYEFGVAYKRAAGVLFPAQEHIPGFADYVNRIIYDSIREYMIIY